MVQIDEKDELTRAFFGPSLDIISLEVGRAM